MPAKGWRKNQGKMVRNNPTHELHASKWGNGHATNLEDVLRYFRGKSPEMREQAIEAIRAMGVLSRYPGRPATKETKTDLET